MFLLYNFKHSFYFSTTIIHSFTFHNKIKINHFNPKTIYKKLKWHKELISLQVAPPCGQLQNYILSYFKQESLQINSPIFVVVVITLLIELEAFSWTLLRNSLWEESWWCLGATYRCRVCQIAGPFQIKEVCAFTIRLIECNCSVLKLRCWWYLNWCSCNNPRLANC